MQSITVEELKNILDQGGTQALIDVRDPWEYEICRIEGSGNIPMMEISNRLEELSKDNDTVVICHHGARSLQVALFLDNLGFKVKNLEGGIDAWASRIDHGMQKY